MSSDKAVKYSITIINSDEKIRSALNESNQYLMSNNELSFRIDRTLWIFRSLEDLLPQTLEKFWSGHMFPLVEANSELENSIQLCKLGFYKHSFIALRNIMELGLLSVYWDIDGKSHENIQSWLYSFENTPFKKTVFEKLLTNQNIKKFNEKHEILKNIKVLFNELSNFAHTKGRTYSGMDLANANFNRFNEKSFLKWLELMTRVIKSVIILHVLQYPVALQHTPIEDKFGINGPAGTFLLPHDSEAVKNFLDKDIMETLQEISDNDPEATSLAQWVNDQPDITEEALRGQLEEFGKMEKHLYKKHDQND
ncbi:MAG: hypothetical protein WAO91_00385 [Candidatus Nitrosotenuis sp.]